MASIMYEQPGGQVALITMDATLSEDHTSAALVTEHAVETGANITDHIRPENDRLVLRFMISNTPTNVPGSNLDGATGSISVAQFELSQPPFRQSGPTLVGTYNPGQFEGKGQKTLPSPVTFEPSPLLSGGRLSAGAAVLQFSQTFDRVRSVYEELRTVVSAGILVSILSGLRTYENMALTNLTAPRTATSGSALEFSVEAVQIRIVETDIVAAPVPVESRAKNRGRKGGQEAKEADSEEQSRSSLLHNLYTSAGIF